jgi:hypothetical protein
MAVGLELWPATVGAGTVVAELPLAEERWASPCPRTSPSISPPLKIN